MASTKKPKRKFVIKIMDMDTSLSKSFTVYETSELPKDENLELQDIFNKFVSNMEGVVVPKPKTRVIISHIPTNKHKMFTLYETGIENADKNISVGVVYDKLLKLAEEL